MLLYARSAGKNEYRVRNVCRKRRHISSKYHILRQKVEIRSKRLDSLIINIPYMPHKSWKHTAPISD